MALQSISELFAGSSRTMEPSDIQHGLEHFVQKELCSEKIHCKISSSSLRLDIRAGSAALVEALIVRERNIRAYAQAELGCSLGEIRVMLDL